MNSVSIKPNSLSIGYNVTGQDFFDTISGFSDFVHSYFFSLTEDVHGNKFDSDKTFKTLCECEKYGMKGNLLLNRFDSSGLYWHLVQKAREIDGLSGVTVIHPKIAECIKQDFPELEVHISVRYWDWLGDRDGTIRTNPFDKIKLLAESGVDVVNISGELHFNNNDVIEYIHEVGMKAKIIINEGCIIGREYNYNKFPEFEEFDCKGDKGGKDGKCGRHCIDLFEKYPWMKLSRIGLFKEDLLYHNYDIFKIASRMISNKDLYDILVKFVLSPRTINLFGVPITDDNYQAFMNWIADRSNCPIDCYNCRKCEYHYNQITK